MLGGGEVRSQRQDAEDCGDDGMKDWKSMGVSIFSTGRSLTERDFQKIGYQTFSRLMGNKPLNSLERLGKCPEIYWYLEKILD